MSVMASFSSTSPPALRTSDPFIGPSHNLPLKALFSPMQRHGWIRLSAHCHIGMPISSKVFKGAIHHCHPRIALSSHGKDKHCCRAPPVFQVRRVTSLDNLLPVICQAWVRGWDERMGALFALPAYQPSQLPRWDGRAGRRMANIRPCGCAIEKYLQTPWPSAYRRRHWLSPQIGYRTPPCSRTPHGFPGRASVIRLFASFIPVPPAPDHHHRRGTGLPVSPFESWFHRLSNIAL